MPKGWNSILGALPNLESLRGGCKGQSNSKGLQNQVSLYLLSTSYGEVNGIKCSETKRKKKCNVALSLKGVAIISSVWGEINNSNIYRICTAC